jgi:hypothetical protein
MNQSMKQKIVPRRVSMIAAAIAVSGLAINATGAPAGHVPATQTQGEVTYIAGGVGEAEAAAIKHVARYYPLELEFLLNAKPKDEYLSDVQVRIKDVHDKMVLNVAADGPFLLAKMPAGKYTVSAERNGKIERRHIVIAAEEHRRVVFEWQG